MHMQLAFCLFKYFEFGGIPRDFRDIALEAVRRGHRVRVYTLRWEGEAVPEFEVVMVPVKAFTNDLLYRRYNQWVLAHIREHPVDLVVGMNKMAGLDAYYAGEADFSYADERAQQEQVRVRAAGRLAGVERLLARDGIGTRRVVEIGSAFGVFLDEARKRGWEARGCEISPASAQHAEEEFGLEIARADLADAGLAPESADLVTGSEVTEVYATGSVRVDPAIGEAGDLDTVTVLLTHADGTISSIDNCRQAVYGYDQRVEAFGSAGVAASENPHVTTTVYRNADGAHGSTIPYFFLERYIPSYLAEWHDFVAMVTEGSPSPVTVHDGRAPLVMGLAAARSIAEGRAVRTDEVG